MVVLFGGKNGGEPVGIECLFATLRGLQVDEHFLGTRSVLAAEIDDGVPLRVEDV